MVSDCVHPVSTVSGPGTVSVSLMEPPLIVAVACQPCASASIGTGVLPHGPKHAFCGDPASPHADSSQHAQTRPPKVARSRRFLPLVIPESRHSLRWWTGGRPVRGLSSPKAVIHRGSVPEGSPAERSRKRDPDWSKHTFHDKRQFLAVCLPIGDVAKRPHVRCDNNLIVALVGLDVMQALPHAMTHDRNHRLGIVVRQKEPAAATWLRGRDREVAFDQHGQHYVSWGKTDATGYLQHPRREVRDDEPGNHRKAIGILDPQRPSAQTYFENRRPIS
jgi:hypothetical protein